MNNTTKSLFVAAIVAGLVGVTSVNANDAAKKDGANGCKGKAGENGCSGENKCKGKKKTKVKKESKSEVKSETTTEAPAAQ